ncbi:hypothetical protein ACJX0J_012161, partial [Zea mays]
WKILQTRTLKPLFHIFYKNNLMFDGFTCFLQHYIHIPHITSLFFYSFHYLQELLISDTLEGLLGMREQKINKLLILAKVFPMRPVNWIALELSNSVFFAATGFNLLSLDFDIENKGVGIGEVYY